MAKVSNKAVYIEDIVVKPDDFLLGTDINNFNRTKSYPIRNIAKTIGSLIELEHNNLVNTSDLINDGENGISKYVETVELINVINDIELTPGPKGDKGDTGEKGDVGATGPVGLTGDQGPIGLTGSTGAQGNPGIQGPKGQQGIDGVDGTDGAIGPQGPIGPVGPTGLQGETGIQGQIGLTGPIGPKGDRGEKGEQGDQGIQGEQGIKGDQGIQGIAGTNGADGIDGAVGAQGIQGEKGEKGDIGSTGATGPQGVNGPQGEVGPQGPIGLTGPQGPIGPRGNEGDVGPAGEDGTGVRILGSFDDISELPATAELGDGYLIDGDLWVYTGTGDPPYRNVGNIKGPKGDKGDTGIQGIQGEVGPQGPIGLTGLTGSQGVQGLQGEQGIQGEVGDTGSQGPQGIQGIEGSVGATGAVGPQGDIGPQGEIGLTGPQGQQGIQGLKGDTGEIGVQGEVGPIGLTGPQGNTGPAGPQGEIGPQGEQGVTGNTGDTGSQGPQGLEGPQGIPGVQGPVGPAGSNATVPDATTTLKGKVKLVGDLSGTADLPTVPELLNKVPYIGADRTIDINTQQLRIASTPTDSYFKALKFGVQVEDPQSLAIAVETNVPVTGGYNSPPYVFDASGNIASGGNVTFNSPAEGPLSFRHKNDYFNEMNYYNGRFSIGVRYDFRNTTHTLYVNGSSYFNGTITTATHGNSGQWNEAYLSSKKVFWEDRRTIYSNDIDVQKLIYGFTTYNNNGSGPYADFLHIGGYSDASGGKSNLVVFNKDSFGMRIYQDTFDNSTTPYTNYTEIFGTHNFDPRTKVNIMENATGIGFSYGNYNDAPYFYHNTGGYKFLATQDYLSDNYVNKSGDSMTNSLQIFKPIQSDVYSGNLQIKTYDAYTSVSHGIGDASLGYSPFVQAYTRQNNNASHYLINPVGGNVGIGTSSNPLERLHILGNTYNQGNENNHIRTITDASGINRIVAGHEYRWYDTYWRTGNQRGDTVNSISYSFEYNGNRVAMIDPNGTIYARNGSGGNSEQWQSAYLKSSMNRGSAFVNNVNANNILSDTEIISIETGNGTGNTNFPGIINYGAFLRFKSESFTTDIINQNDGEMYFKNWYNFSPLGAGQATWRKIIHDGNISEYTGDSIFTQTPEGGIKTNIWSSNALSPYSVAIGHLTSAIGLGNTQIGFGQNGNGTGNTSVGYMSNISGDFSTNVGVYNGSTKSKSTLVGLGLTNNQEGLTIIGRYNEPTSNFGYDNTNSNKKKEVLVLAAGVDDDNRKNIFTTTADDRTRVINGVYYDTQYRDQVDFTPTTLIDRRYFEENSGGGSSILQNYTFQDASIDDVYNGEVIEGLGASGTVNQSLGELTFAVKHVSLGGFYHAITPTNIYGQLLCFSSTTLGYTNTTLLKGHINVNNNMIATHDVINKPHVYLLISVKGIEIINTDANTVRNIMVQTFAGTYTNVIRLGTFLTVGTNELLFYFDPTIII